MPELNQSEISSTLRFANADNVDQAADAITELIRTKHIFAILGSDEYRQGLLRLASFVDPLRDDRTRLMALATLEKMRVTLKKKGSEVSLAIQKTVALPLPSLQTLEEAEQRYYVASALALAPRDRLVAFVPKEILLEERSDKTWKCLTTVLLAAAGTSEAFLSLLGESQASEAISTDKSGDVAAKRLKRILFALRLALQELSSESGSRVGDKLAHLLRATFRTTRQPDDASVARQLSEEIALLIDDFVRAQISLVVDATVYTPLQICKRWFPLSTWSQYVGKSPAMAKLARTITEGIRISTSQGLMNQGLVDSLELVRGSRDRALQVTARIADSNSGLPEQLQHWLRNGRASGNVPHGHTADESALLRADDYVALALLDAVDLEDALSSPDKDVAIGTRATESREKQAYETRCRALISAVQSLASARAIRLVGRRGDTVEYSPLQHVITDGSSPGRLVQILRAGVERVEGSGNTQLLKKILVAPAP
jgi:hypothetical protein